MLKGCLVANVMLYSALKIVERVLAGILYGAATFFFLADEHGI